MMAAGNQPTDITQLIEQTERTDFLSGTGRNLRDETEEDLQAVESFLEESNRRLSVIKAEKISDNQRLVTFDLEDGAVEDICASREQEGSDEEKNEKEENAFQILKQALHDLIHIQDFLPSIEASGGSRPRTTSMTDRSTRLASTSQALESGAYKVPSTPNNVPVSRTSTKVMTDINSLEVELAKLLTMRDSLDYRPAAPTDKEPFPVPAAPPCTPATTSSNHPLSPTEIYNRGHRTQSLPGNTMPPPKPPRSFHQTQQAASSSKSHAEEEAGKNHLLKGPPKPPRLNSTSSIDKLKIQLAKMSRSMGNLSVLEESQESSAKPTKPSSSGCLEVDDKDLWRRASGNKVENFFSKFSAKKKTKRSKSITISSPSDFRHVSGRSRLPELQTENLPPPKAATEAQPETPETTEVSITVSRKTSDSEVSSATSQTAPGAAEVSEETSRTQADPTEAQTDQLDSTADITRISSNATISTNESTDVPVPRQESILGDQKCALHLSMK
ncbi:uncharacterized protein LOC135197945 [Macrobrachium nipponense]|uniref:uncharacterized protein LOC135197945 n=1 Tax=Macrobrachium nipponense TaxID=159736 RepID=UPI0030C7E2E7